MFISNKNLVTFCGGLAIGIASHALGYPNNLVYVASAVGAIFSRFIFNSMPESGFEPFRLDINRFKCVGDIDNNSMFAHRCQPLADDKEGLCSFLRDMDQKEYEQVEKEHLEIGGTLKPMDSLAVGIAGGGGALGILSLGSRIAMGTWEFFEACAAPLFALATFGFGLAAGGSHYVNAMEKLSHIESARASRLSEKIHKLSSRISTLDSDEGYPKETLQLKVAKDYFSNTLQKNSNQITVYHRT